MDDRAVRCVNITKYFGGVQALNDVSLDLNGSEIVCLTGDNGAGKSTLVKILGGIHQPDSGEIRVGDRIYRLLTPAEARANGIEIVYQHLSLCDNLGAAANVMLGSEPVRFRLGPLRWIDTRKSQREAAKRLAEVGTVLEDLVSPVRRLSGGQRQSIAIARVCGRVDRKFEANLQSKSLPAL